MALAAGIVQFITVYIVATDIRTTVEVVTIITTTITTGQIIPTDRIDPTDRSDRSICLHKDQREAWVVPPCREAVVALAAVAVVVAVVVVARFGWARV